MSTIKDVAEYAGVSQSTVSKYLNNPEKLLPKYREQVQNAILALNYTPSLFARSMRTNRTMQIALVVASFQSQHSLEFMDAVMSVARPLGYNLITLCTEENFEGVEKVLSTLQSRMFDGAILAYVDYDDSVLPLIANMIQVLPCVLFTNSPYVGSSSNIVINMFDGSYLVAEYLIGLGHKRIAFCGGFKDSFYMKEKERAYKTAMERHGYEIPKGYIGYGVNSGLITGYKNASFFLSLAERPTAIMAANDILAIGCIKAAKNAGLKVPEDIAVTGFDGITMSELYDPAITTYKQPIERMARLGLELLLNRINDQDSKAETVVCNGKVIIRQSTELDAPVRITF